MDNKTNQKFKQPQKPVQKPQQKPVQKQPEKSVPLKAKKQNQPLFPMDRDNFILMGIGVLLMIIGYIFMYGDKDIFSFRKLSLSVIFVLGGFLFEIFAIMKKPKEKKTE